MTRQYTFKTTQDTEWIEPYLDSMGRLQRSEYIRNALITSLQGKEPPVVPVTQVPQVTPVRRQKVEAKVEEPVFETKEIDLDAQLDSLYE